MGKFPFIYINNKRRMMKKYILLTTLVLATMMAFCQSAGKLFIIGGGDRSEALMNELVQVSNLQPTDYIVVLPMATSVPEESFAFVRKQLSQHCSNPVVSFDFTKEQANQHQSWIDSVKFAKLIYITGGDQSKFMDIVRGSRLYEAMHQAYSGGATISGTSAGAAVMSAVMITGEQRGEREGSNLKSVKRNTVVTAEGMGFLRNSIIDQHFIIRSRYNRLLSVLSDHPKKMLIGIDESTALVIHNNIGRVVGDSQVVVVSDPQKIKVFSSEKVEFKKAKIALLGPGQTFNIR
ncbi:MAG TPA: cyanophycinase [Sphingobacterium sp.]|nr:cyanophycinase [Sphingobacterium sp.]